MFQLNVSFADAYHEGRFLQQELITQSELIREAHKLGLVQLTQDRLEELDRAGAFCPIAFVRGPWSGRGDGFRWNTERMTFRKEAGSRPWSRYRFQQFGHPSVTALYSRWQLLYLKAAMREPYFLVPLQTLLGRPALREKFIKSRLLRKLWRMQLEGWRDLDRRMKPVVLLLCWLQNRYLPFVTGKSSLFYNQNGDLVDPMAAEFKSFKPKEILERLGITADGVDIIYDWLGSTGWTCDPLPGWYDVVRAAPPSSRATARFEDNARYSQLFYDAAEICRRFLKDATGTAPWDINERTTFPVDWKEKLLGHDRRVYYDLDDFKLILEDRGLSPYGIHVFVEGPSDVKLIGGLIEDLWNSSCGEMGVHFTELGGIGYVERHAALVKAFSNYARYAILVVDDEGKIDRDVKNLQRDGLLTDPHAVKKWDRNLEEDSFSDEEILAAARAAARANGGRLKMTLADLRSLKATSTKGVLSLIVDNATTARISKPEVAEQLKKKIVREVKAVGDADTVAERRVVLKLALGIARAARP